MVPSLIRLMTMNQTCHVRPSPTRCSAPLPPVPGSQRSQWGSDSLERLSDSYISEVFLLKTKQNKKPNTSDMPLLCLENTKHWSQLALASLPLAVAGSQNATYLFLRIISLLFWWQRLKTGNKKKWKPYFSINRWQKCECECTYARKGNQKQL